MEDNSKETDDMCSLLMSEEPKIEYVVKNVLTLLLAGNMSTTMQVEREERMTPGIVIGCGRLFVRTVNNFQLMDPLEWGIANPQGEMPGLQRIEEVSRYRIAHLLWKKVKDRDGKVCKLFGKHFLLWTAIMEPVYKHIIDLCSGPNAPVPIETMTEFMALIISTLVPLIGKSSDTNELTSSPSFRGTTFVPKPDILLPGYEDLIWSDKFSALLQKKQLERWQKVDSRETWNVGTDMATEGVSMAVNTTGSEDGSESVLSRVGDVSDKEHDA